MANSQSQPPLPAAMRREAMLDALQQSEFLRVTELGERFSVSEVTVRADLDALVALGEVRRVHGGAMPATNKRLERSFEDAAGANADEKAAIAREAAMLVASGDVVALDVGTTTTALAIALRRREDLERVTVITNGLNIALELERANPRISVIVTGGTLRPLQHSLVNPLATMVLLDDQPRRRVRRLQRRPRPTRRDQREPARGRGQARDALRRPPPRDRRRRLEARRGRRREPLPGH